MSTLIERETGMSEDEYRAVNCCNTHCERGRECRSPHDCSSSAKPHGEAAKRRAIAQSPEDGKQEKV